MHKSDARILLKTLLLWVLLLAGALTRPLLAQPTSFRSEAEAAKHKEGFLAAARAAGYTQRPEFFYKYRLDITKTKQLRRAKVDLLRMDREILIDGAPDYFAAGLFSDLVVHGVVVKQTGDSSRTVYYHSAFQVQVFDTWQGLAPADTVVARLLSGPLGTGYVTESMGPELKQGQELVVFLYPVDFVGYAAAEKQGLAMYRNNAAPGDFDVVKVIPVKDGRVFGGRVKLARARRHSKRIAAILDKEHFYEKEFSR